MQRFVLIVLIYFAAASCGGRKENELKLIPYPQKVSVDNGRYISGNKFVVYSDNNRLSGYFSTKAAGLFSSETSGERKKGNEDEFINIWLTSDKSIHESEKYKLDITDKNIKITAGSDAGLFYGLQTLLQLISDYYENGWLKLPLMQIEDWPHYKWRGMHLDVSRHFFDKEFIKKYIDVLAMHKMNVFHWHLTDDQGWRIEIDAYPKLTEIGAWRKGNGKEPWNYEIEAAVKGEPRYGGYYTKEDIREIVKYAQERYVTIVPEIELPGHSWAALYAYPQLSCSGVPWVKPADVAFEFSDPFCAGNEDTYKFFETVFTEVMELFPSPYIHLGGDEAKKTPWEKCPKCRKKMTAQGLKNVDELQTYFVNRIAAFIESKGRKVVGWDEIIKDNPKRDLIIMNWRDREIGIEAVKKGNPVIFTPGAYLYFNVPQFPNGNENTPFKRIITLNDVYNYRPSLDGERDAKKNSAVLGMEGCLWTEWVYSDEQALERLLPRLAALSENSWSSPVHKNYKAFLNRLDAYFTYLNRNNINYFISPPQGLYDDVFVKTPYRIKLSADLKNTKIYYTLDNIDPDENSLLYKKPIELNNSATVKAVCVLPSGRKSRTIKAYYKKVEYQAACDTVLDKQGLKTSYFTGAVSTLDEFDKLQKESEFISPQAALADNHREDDFGYLFEGFIKIPQDDLYTFYLSSDDGSRLYIDDKLLIDNDGLHAMGDVIAKTALRKGFHKFKLLFFEAKYGQGLELKISSDKLEKQIIPAEMLFH